MSETRCPTCESPNKFMRNFPWCTWAEEKRDGVHDPWHDQPAPAARAESAADHDWRRQMEAYGYDNVSSVGKQIDAAWQAGYERGRVAERDKVNADWEARHPGQRR